MAYDFVTPTSEGVSPDSFPVVPDDVKDLYRPVRFLRASVAGIVRADTQSGHTRDMAFLAGETRFVILTKVYATGTTADGLEGMP